MTKDTLLKLFYDFDDGIYELLSINFDNEPEDVLEALENSGATKQFVKSILDIFWKED